MRYWVAPSEATTGSLISRRPELSSRGPAAREVPYARHDKQDDDERALHAARGSTGMAALQAQEGTARDTMPPQAHISNGQIKATLYLPDPERGFYRSTRFDWSGVIASLEYNGHRSYGPWFTGSDPSVRDFVYRGADILVSAQSGVVGPAEGIPAPAGICHGETGRDVGRDWRRRVAQAR